MLSLNADASGVATSAMAMRKPDSCRIRISFSFVRITFISSAARLNRCHLPHMRVLRFGWAMIGCIDTFANDERLKILERFAEEYGAIRSRVSEIDFPMLLEALEDAALCRVRARPGCLPTPPRWQACKSRAQTARVALPTDRTTWSAGNPRRDRGANLERGFLGKRCQHQRCGKE